MHKHHKLKDHFLTVRIPAKLWDRMHLYPVKYSKVAISAIEKYLDENFQDNIVHVLKAKASRGGEKSRQRKN